MSNWTSLSLLLALAAFVAFSGAESEFSRYWNTRPRLLHARPRRDLAAQAPASAAAEARDAETLSVLLEVGARPPLLLELRLNSMLLPRGHALRAHNLTRTLRTPLDTELCQYRGTVRGESGSWVAMSTCHGLRGVVSAGGEVYYIEPTHDATSSKEEWGAHRVYRHSDLLDADQEAHIYSRTRRKRDASELRAPFNSNRKTRYVELALVVDNEIYRASGESLELVHRNMKDLANIVSAMYEPLNIFIALVYVEVWTERDRIQLQDKADDTLSNFNHYRRNNMIREHYNDNAQLITLHRFESNIVGRAHKGMMCSLEYSAGITTNHSQVLGLIAATVAHEMGHNFGMEHDNEGDCTCADKTCIMTPSSSTVRPTSWSSCSKETLTLAFNRGLDYCLRNMPTSLFESPTCGNGFLEAGEECDCGVSETASACAACCHSDTCMLRSNATCATGACCDLARCAVRAAGHECRPALQECDLPEYCTGSSEYCPDDVHKMDSLPCDSGAAFCHAGQCRSHTDQCRLLWGASGEQSHERCYDMNFAGNGSGNCGYNRMSMQYARCERQDVLCGLLHCRHLNEQLEFGSESVATMSYAFINIKGAILPCRTVLVDLGTQQPDPGLAPDGAKCGHDKMCLKQRCVSVESVRASLSQEPGSVCPSDCAGQGFCNSKGSCHCNRGFAPPLCELPGPGGSLQSGPATDPSVQWKFMVTMYVVFLGVIPTVLLLLLLAYYSKHHALCRATRKLGSQSGQLQRRLSRGASKLAASLQSAPAPAPGPRACAAADSLLAADTQHLFGQFAGFRLTPLETPEGAEAWSEGAWGGDGRGAGGGAGGGGPIRSAPPPPAPASLQRANTTIQNRIKALIGDKPGVSAEATTLPRGTTRPTISSPLADSMRRAAVPRAAPPAPAPLKPLPSEPHHLTPFNRIASFLNKDKPFKPLERSHSLPKNNNPPKLSKPVDKGALRNLQISGPILQQDIALSVPTVPVSSAPQVTVADSPAPSMTPGAEQVVRRANDSITTEAEQVARANGSTTPGAEQIARAHSMRGARALRPGIASFGSMRVRPTSVALPARPTSPPPPAPPAPPPPVAPDNIYAVIEESRAPAGPSRTAPQPPPAGYTAPRPVPSLLGEIVSEIQTRNLESIYSTAPAPLQQDAGYANSSAASTTSSGYLVPAAINAPQPPPSRIPTLGRQPTPPALRTNLAQPQSTPQPEDKTPRDNTPDVVVSCGSRPEPPRKSPDLVHARPPLKLADKKTAVKPAPLPKVAPASEPKPAGRLAPASRSPLGAKPDASKTKPRVTRPAPAPRPRPAGAGGNVASLQHKFESRKPGSAATPAPKRSADS